ncbi:PQ-loop domain-containing transporter [Bacillus paranthracis]|uniref:PQ-loop domain-containing transporter n=1 Tax=Bacillus paranthracis TaxID=2026186 RepID=UPI002D779050|nr:PQ-loop domain-containing transporter [Bacillus paranthracis]
MTTLITLGLVLQTLGSVLLLGGYAPQIVKLHKTRIPTGISLLFWTMIGTGCTTILVNMIIHHTSIEVIITQALNAIGAWYTLGLVIYCKKLKGEAIKVNKYIVIVYLALAFSIVYDLRVNELTVVGDHIQLVGSIALLTAYLPQIFHLNRVKDATGISRWLFIVLGTGLLAVTGNMIITGTNVWIIATEFLNIALIFVQFGMTVYYQNKKLY